MLQQSIGQGWREAYNSAFDRKNPMNYVKGILSGLAAIFLAEFVQGPWSMFKGIREQKATGLGAVAGGLMGSAFSPLFWSLVLLFFALFFAASRLGNKILRDFLFWIPTLTVSALGPAIVALLTYVFIHFRIVRPSNSHNGDSPVSVHVNMPLYVLTVAR